MISRRLLALAGLCPRKGSLVDIGSDHGLLPRYLLDQGFHQPLYATELSDASFKQLKAKLHDLPISVYQADGLTDLPADIQTVVIAGMGGHLIVTILNHNLTLLNSIQTLVLAPQRDIALVRNWLQRHGWAITDENFIFEQDQPYPMFKAEKGPMNLTEITAEFGPILVHKPNQDFLQWLSVEITLQQTIVNQSQDNTKRTRLEWMKNYVKHHPLT
jgi:tRNA (adenine22-N1)-methyltransferase